MQPNTLEDVSGPVREKKEVAAEAWKNSAAVDKRLRCVTYVYLEHVNSASACMVSI